MTLAKFCKDMGMNVKQYEETDLKIREYAATVFENAKEFCNPGSGMYYPIEKLCIDFEGFEGYVIQKLKWLGMEFFDNNRLFRI